ncbi:MAG: hypothetical protein ACRBBN_13290 [Methyloligellaceae bacterium]
MSDLAVFYIILLLLVTVASVTVDRSRRAGTARIWPFLDLCSGAAKAVLVLNFYYKFISPDLLVPLITLIAGIDLSSYVRDYERVKMLGLVYVILIYAVSTILIAPAYIYGILALS